MVIDRASKIIYNEPITVLRVKHVDREKTDAAKNREMDNWHRKTPIRSHVMLYDYQGHQVGTGAVLDVYA